MSIEIPDLEEIKAEKDYLAIASSETIADGKEPYGHVHYADPGYQKDGKKRYPIDTESHIRAAWNYIHKPHNASKYTPEQVSHIKSKIVSAWKSKIDPKGPPSAHDAKAEIIAYYLNEEKVNKKEKEFAKIAFGKYRIDGKIILI